MTLQLGIIVSLAEGPEAAIDRVAALGLPTCQVAAGDHDLLTEANAARLRQAAAARGVAVTTIWTHCRGGQVWDFVDGRPVQNAFRSRSEIPTETDVSRRISKALRAEGFNFCGPTIVYAFMQAVGMVNDHLVECHRHAECAALGARS